MTCELSAKELDTYLDGELAESETRSLEQHLKGCTDCAALILSKVQMKQAIRTAGQRYKPDAAFRARMQQKVQQSLAQSAPFRLNRLWFPLLAGPLVLVAVLVFALLIGRQPRSDDHLLSELADLHVATLASANPVDVVSTDRHTVKPWFQGKIPFTFNLPELQDSPFTLVGGKTAYLRQSPGAELVFRVRQHQISVFIFQERTLGNLRGLDEMKNAESFSLRSWSHNGLRYFEVGDVAGADLDRLRELIQAAG